MATVDVDVVDPVAALRVLAELERQQISCPL